MIRFSIYNQSDERCENCMYYRTLKHKFNKHVGFIDSKCCIFFSDDPAGSVVEVNPNAVCESFTQVSHET